MFKHVLFVPLNVEVYIWLVHNNTTVEFILNTVVNFEQQCLSWQKRLQFPLSVPGCWRN